LKGETAAIVRFTAVFGGKEGIKVETRGDRNEGNVLLASRLMVRSLVELLDETQEGGVGTRLLIGKDTKYFLDPTSQLCS
jgi:hypothetical protein